MEQQTKNCPYCGGEIMAAAKKCKHCGKWLDGREEKKEILVPEDEPAVKEVTPQEIPLPKEEPVVKEKPASKRLKQKKCPYCGEEIMVVAKKCKHCGEWLDESAAPKSSEKSDDDSSDADDKNIGILSIEPFIIFGFMSGLYDWSYWKAVLAAFVVVAILYISRIFRVIFSILFSALWGFVSILLCPWIFNESEFKVASRLITNDYTDYWYVGLGVFVAALILHWTSMQDDK